MEVLGDDEQRVCGFADAVHLGQLPLGQPLVVFDFAEFLGGGNGNADRQERGDAQYRETSHDQFSSRVLAQIRMANDGRSFWALSRWPSRLAEEQARAGSVGSIERDFGNSRILISGKRSFPKKLDAQCGELSGNAREMKGFTGDVGNT